MLPSTTGVVLAGATLIFSELSAPALSPPTLRPPPSATARSKRRERDET
jgi:hypothetical protein